jgi:hypothetical protein
MPLPNYSSRILIEMCPAVSQFTDLTVRIRMNLSFILVLVINLFPKYVLAHLILQAL